MLTTEELLKRRTLGDTDFSGGGLSSMIGSTGLDFQRTFQAPTSPSPLLKAEQPKELTNIGTGTFTGFNPNVQQGSGFLNNLLGTTGGATTPDGTILPKNIPETTTIAPISPTTSATGINYNFLPGETVDAYQKRIAGARGETTQDLKSGVVGGTIGDAGQMIKPTTSSDVMDAIRNLSTTANGLQEELNQLKNLPTDTSTTEKKDDYDSQMKELQMQITQKILENMTPPDEGTIMDKYDARELQLKEASEAAKELIESRSATAIEEEETEGTRRLEAEREARRGFATNRAMFTQMEETTAKRVRDLGVARDDALASQNYQLAESLSDLIGKEEEAITSARQQNFTNLMALSGEIRNLRGFETPEETRIAEGFETPAEAREAGFQNSLALMGATKSADYAINQAENLQKIQTTYANIEGMAEATSIEQAIGLMGPELAKDVELSRALNEAKLNQINVATMDALSSSGGSQLAETQTVMLSDGKFLPGVLDDIEILMSENEGLFGRVTGRVGFSESREITKAQLLTASQLVGRFMEGGVLRKEDEEKYAKMLPKLTDQYSVAESKLNAVRTMLQMKYNSYLTDFSGAGYDVSGFSAMEISNSGSGLGTGTDNNDPFAGLDQ